MLKLNLASIYWAPIWYRYIIGAVATERNTVAAPRTTVRGLVIGLQNQRGLNGTLRDWAHDLGSNNCKRKDHN